MELMTGDIYFHILIKNLVCLDSIIDIFLTVYELGDKKNWFPN